MTKQTKFIIAISLQVLIILIIIGFKLLVLTGTDVMLKIQPVDPRDWLRGDYVTFQYDISRVPGYYFTTNGLDQVELKINDIIYVELRDHGGEWIASAFSKKPPTDGSVYIRGKVKNIRYASRINSTDEPKLINSTISIEYGIEQYFIPEGTGQGVSFVNKDVVAQVTVDDHGNAVLKQVYVDKKPWP